MIARRFAALGSAVLGALFVLTPPSAVAGTIALPTLSSEAKQAISHLPSAHARSRAAKNPAPDLTGDRIPDVLTVATDTSLAAHAGTGAVGGSGAFAAGTGVGSIPSDRRYVGQADFTGDGYNDIMSLSTGGSLYLAQHSGTVNGAATFRPEKNIANGWQSASLILVTDFLGKDRNNPTELDGLADILFRVPTDNGIYLYVNQGLDSNGNLTFFSWGKLLNDTQAVTSMAAADVTADGFPDLCTTFTDGSARLLDFFAEQDSSGNWIAKWYTITATGADVYDTRLLTDVNDDGFPDLVTRTKATGELDVALHTRNWNPAAPSAVFDTTNRKVLATGWGTYRIVT